MPQTKKGNQWHFGMKAHLGTDRASGLVHTVVATAANVADISQTAQPLHGRETQVYADAGYVGVEKRGEIRAKDPAGRIGWQLARNGHQLHTFFGLANVVIGGRTMAAA